MAIKHTPEPWVLYGRFIYEDTLLMGRATVAETFGDGISAPANAARIVACVNGCKGINPEAVQDLLAALKAMEEWAQQIEDEDSRVPVHYRLAARAAIAKAEAP